MSSDQWDPEQMVRVRLRLEDGSEAWSGRLLRWQAERQLASAPWLALPTWNGRRVVSAAIVIWAGS